MKKFYIKDDEGEEYSVEEVSEDETCDEDLSQLTSDEISALKKLASIADKLIALTSTEDEDIDEEKVEEKEEEFDDEDEDKETFEEENEEVVDTDEDKKFHDSKFSAASIKSKKNSTNDSVDIQTEIADAWTKRYGGNK